MSDMITIHRAAPPTMRAVVVTRPGDRAASEVRDEQTL